MEIRKEGNLEINNFEITALKILTRLTLQENIDEEIIDLMRELQLEYYMLMKKYEVLEERVNIDTKTNLLKYNEAYLVNIVKAISRYLQASQKTHNLSISYIRLDLDDFSKINNRYGHDVGDKVLVAVSETLRKLSRPTDYLFRFGGEEFDIVLPVTPIEGAEVFVKKVMDSINNLKIPVDNDDNSFINITGSFGISHIKIDFDTLKVVDQEEIIKLYNKVQKEADYACYHAKYSGKNCYKIYDPSIDYKQIMKEYSEKAKK